MFLKYNIIIWYQTKCILTLSITLHCIPNLLLPSNMVAINLLKLYIHNINEFNAYDII